TNLNKVCFDYLPYSQKEVVSIYKLFNKNERPARIYLFNEADESNFKKSLLSSKYTHVATHGFVNNSMPDMTFLAFSQSTVSKGLSLTSSDSEDNFLFAKEIYSLTLTSELVVLSSCESGLGKMMKGEGMMSMARAFSFAGAKNIVFSLFKVPDKHTKELMVNFYTYILDDKDYADALRKAKLNLITDNMNSLPLFWAGFIMIGK
ncbi:MAG: CHAT domain-containing protein, partial [Bacteroidales bacterium]